MRIGLCLPALVMLSTVLMRSVQVSAAEKEICIYRARDGSIKQVNSRSSVPPEFRNRAQCFSARENKYLAKPEEIELKGTVRREELLSPVGRIELRWPRVVEVLFGRTPQRAMVDAASAVNRALKKPGFPPDVQRLNLDWQVVFMDEKLPEKQIPAYLVNSCHPAWMAPPASIYVIAQRVAAGCSSQKVDSSTADMRLAQALIHEMGHAVEHKLLETAFSMDRMQAEGFATWFEIFASDYSSIIPRGKIEKEHLLTARQAVRESPAVFNFAGSALDYSRAGMYFQAIVERRGVSGLMGVYKAMQAEKIGFFAAVKKSTGWDQNRLEKEVQKLVG